MFTEIYCNDNDDASHDGDDESVKLVNYVCEATTKKIQGKR